MSRKRHGTRRGGLIAAILGLALLLTGCGPADEAPTTERWRATWEEIQQVVPPRHQVTVEEEACQRVLTALRSAHGDAFPAPDDVISGAAQEWFDYAEHVFFTCFEGTDVDTAYAVLDQHRAEVDAALDARQ